MAEGSLKKNFFKFSIDKNLSANLLFGFPVPKSRKKNYIGEPASPDTEGMGVWANRGGLQARRLGIATRDMPA